MSRRALTMSVGAALIVALAVIGVFIPVPYAALGPGPTFDTLGSVDGTKVITVTDKAGKPENTRTSGQLRLVTVGVRDHLDLLSALRGWFDGSVAVVPREEIFPPDESQQQVDKENTQEFVQSQDAAQAAALGELHYPEQIVVKQVQAHSASQDRLRSGDVIASLDGGRVTSPDQLIKALTAVKPGSQVRVGYQRDGHAGLARITTEKASQRGGSALGVLVSAERVAPFKINVSLSNIGGPSAGLMFALGIVEKIGGKDLTGGKFVAGTGTIDANGKVGPIGGIPQKMLGAKRDGATTFLVPQDNCAEARSTAPSGLRLVKVDSLHSAIAALRSLEQGGNPAGC
ncbi:MAG TPA: PDZ domain-containing protein [Mycobacteriales bacterium]|nr:PDZ domain-containing protein [Mycobacteriales bacterium]